jgi:hypothetical protein
MRFRRKSPKMKTSPNAVSTGAGAAMETLWS